MPPEVAVGPPLLQLVAAHPLGHGADDRIVGRAEFGRTRRADAGERAGGLDHRHLHAETDAEIGHGVFAGEAGGEDLALGAARAEAAGHQDAVDAGQVRDRVFLLEYLRIDPAQLDPCVVGDAAMGQRLLERFVGVLQAGIFAGDGDRHLAFRPDHPVDDAHPLAQLRLSGVEPEIAADRGIESFAVQLQRQHRRWFRRRAPGSPGRGRCCRTARSCAAPPPGFPGRSGTAGCPAGCRGRAVP